MIRDHRIRKVKTLGNYKIKLRKSKRSDFKKSYIIRLVIPCIKRKFQFKFSFQVVVNILHFSRIKLLRSCVFLVVMHSYYFP